MKGLASALIIALIVVAIFSNLLVLVKETNQDVFNALKAIGGHHWTGHGIVTTIVFIAFTVIAYYGYASRKEINPYKLAIVAATVLIIMSLAVVGFFASLS